MVAAVNNRFYYQNPAQIHFMLWFNAVILSNVQNCWRGQSCDEERELTLRYGADSSSCRDADNCEADMALLPSLSGPVWPLIASS